MTGPIGFAIDGKDETAWGIDIGPGRRNQPRKAVFTAREADRVSRRDDPDLQPEAKPRRLEQRRQPELQPRPVPAVDHDRAEAVADPVPAARFATILAIPREKRTAGANRPRVQLLANDGAGVEDANAWIEALWKQHPEGSTQLVLCEREEPRGRRTSCSGVIFSSRARRSSRACRRS